MIGNPLTEQFVRIDPAPSNSIAAIPPFDFDEAPHSTMIPDDELGQELWLPDLQTLPPTNLRLFHDQDSGRTHIRFNNSIWNSGPGKLELIGNPDQARDQIQVIQRIYGSDSGEFEQHEVGKFVFHSEHNHWHLEQFASYEIWSVDEQGTLKTKVTSGEKVSYCVMDVSLAEGDQSEGVILPYRSYTHCEENRQGLSVGWVDTYKYFYPGQSVEVSSLKDGIYALVSTVDPLHLLMEGNTHNNSAIVYFELREQQLNIVDYLFIEEEGEPKPQ